jgi:predicted RNA-binding protein with PIN domain
MTTLIDGYNVLFAARIVPRRRVGALEQARHQLLEFLAAKLTPTEAQQTVVIFDAKRQSRRDGPEQGEFRGFTVIFARDHDEADDLLEQLIRRDPVPEKLVVVSADRRVQQAARRRRARVVDSDTWLGELEQRRTLRMQAEPPPASSDRVGPGDEPLSPEQTQAWLQEFGIEPGPAAKPGPSGRRVPPLRQ